MIRQLVFLLPRIDKNVFSARALLERQDFYASYLAREQEGNIRRAIALYSGTEKPVDSKSFNFIEPVWLGPTKLSLFSFFIKSLGYLKSLRGVRLILIAGTPFQPLLIARLISLRIRNSAIQVSIHGELDSIKQSRIKYLFLKSQLRHVSCLRFVSGAQRNDFFKQRKFAKLPSVIAPVPISTEFNLGSNAPRNSLGFIGRIHEERDPLLWVEIANLLPEIPKLVVGDGPLLNEMRATLRNGEFTGALAGDEIEEIWRRLQVLLSTAPYESYGLTIREALLHEVPVIAKTSAGAKDLALRFPNLVRLFENPKEAIALIYELRESPPTNDEYKSFKKWFVESQSESLNALAKLWAEM